MRVLIDISHPAHVHFYRHLYARLRDAGADVRVVGREKDVTVRLLEAYGIPHQIVGRSGHTSRLAQFVELIRRDWFLYRTGRKLRAQIVLTRNPAGVQAARLLGATGIFDTDDGRSVGIHYRAAAPFAHVITAPDSLTESFGAKGRKYPSYKALAYLHPSVYTPDPSIRGLLGIGDAQFSVVRLVAHDASHDRHSAGLDGRRLREVIALLGERGPVFVSRESGTDAGAEARILGAPPERIHDVLAEAWVVVGDSQTVVTEAALLGTPAVRINTWAHSSPHITELEERYGLARSFLPEEINDALMALKEIRSSPTKEEWQRRRAVMLAEKINLTDWYFDLVTEITR